MSKKTIQGQNEGLPKTYFGSIDTALFISYGIAQFGTGTIGDIFKKRYVLTISFTIQALLFAAVAWTGLVSDTE